ncbi:MAG: ABC transporter permease [Desulfamplus sp.]|nr:ABC transporter permease [Desulfamplus sp.]
MINISTHKNILRLNLSIFISIYKYHQLLREFVIRDIKGRFAGSFAGILWTVINPLATIVAYFFVFSLVLKINVTVEDVGTDRFILFFLSGFFPWILFAESLTKSTGSVVAQAGLVTKVIFPVELIPVSSIISAFIINGTGFIIFLLYLAFTGFAHISWFCIPILLFIEMLFALGLSLFLAAFCVFIRDTTEILSIVMMLWFYATPVVYPDSMIPQEIANALSFNPMSIFVQCMRDILLRNQVDVILMLKLFVISLIFLVPCSYFFMRSKPAFGDVL